MKTILLLASAATVSLATAGSAATLDASQLLNQFNLIVKGDVTNATSSVEGRVLIGGDMQSGNLETHRNLSSGGGVPESDYDAVVIEGNVGGLLRVGNSGDASVGSVSGSTDMQGGTLTTGSPVNAPENFGAVLDDLSRDLSELIETGSEYMVGQRLTFAANADDMTVFDVDWTQLYSNSGYNVSDIGFDFSGNSDGIIVINVAGATGGFTNSNAPDAYGQQVLWNFHEATNISFNSGFVGSILASDADVRVGGGAIEGTLFANNVVLNAQIHRQNFVGLPQQAAPVSPVPLPAGLPMLLTAVGGIAALRRLRNRRAA